jgi:hypothetical protein
MQRSDAEREIIREWEALHVSQRETERHAAMFAMAIKDKYPFKYEGDRYQAIKAIIAKHQNIKASPLRDNPSTGELVIRRRNSTAS